MIRTPLAVLALSPFLLSVGLGQNGTPSGPGWPVALGDHLGPGVTGPLFVDLDRDGPDEVLVANGRKVHVRRANGSPVAGFPVTLDGVVYDDVAVGDLDADGDMEIVVTTFEPGESTSLWVLDHRGKPGPGFPIPFGAFGRLQGAPTLADLDDDGELEILVQVTIVTSGHLFVVEADASIWSTGNWPVVVAGGPSASPAIADLDGDDALEIVVATDLGIYTFERDGSLRAGWPQYILGATVVTDPAVGDLDGDGDAEIVVAANFGAARLLAYDADGTLRAGFPIPTSGQLAAPPTISDLDGDGQREILYTESVAPNSRLWAIDGAGVALPGFPYAGILGSVTQSPITTHDLDGDGELEILVGTNSWQGMSGFLYGVDTDGSAVAGFPKKTTWVTQEGAVIGDPDGDGDLDLAVATLEPYASFLEVIDLDRAYRPSPEDWTARQKSATRTADADRSEHLALNGKSLRGGTMELVVHGEAHGVATIWISGALAPIDTPFGWVLLDRSVGRTLVDAVDLGPYGRRSFSFGIPNSLPLVGTPLHVQGVILGMDAVATELETVVIR